MLHAVESEFVRGIKPRTTKQNPHYMEACELLGAWGAGPRDLNGAFWSLLCEKISGIAIKDQDEAKKKMVII